MAVTNLVVDQRKPARHGNTVFGRITGTFVDTAPTYANSLAAVSGYFLPSPPPRIVYIANNVANGYSYIAEGRVV